jgi:hypothetical protein
VWHSLRNHYFPLYFPEVEGFLRSNYSDWLIQLLLLFPTPGAVTALPCEEFIAQAWSVIGRKVRKAALLTNIYRAAQRSIALPVATYTAAIGMFRLMLEQYLTLGRLREHIAQDAEAAVGQDADCRRLMTAPGIGLTTALTIVAEAGDLRRFAIIASS